MARKLHRPPLADGARRAMRDHARQCQHRLTDADRPIDQPVMCVYQRCMVARCLSREVANNVQKVAQFYRQMFHSNLFKSSPNAVVSLTGPTASRLPSSCQSTHLLLAFVQRKTFEKFGGKNILLPNISPNFGYRVPNFFVQLESNGLHMSAKFRERIPNRGSQEANQIFHFFGRWSSLTKDIGKLGIVS